MSKYSETDETGDIGVDIVSLKVKKEFSWIFREQVKNDLGIDGHIEIINDSREGTGRLIAAQIKTGASYFENEKQDGYVFYGKSKHLKYWLLHSLPVIIILCDEKNDICYWVEVTRTNVHETASGWSILVPKNQILNNENKKRLTFIAGMPQHSDIVELALFKFLSEKYSKYSKFGRLDICPPFDEPRDFMYFTCLGMLEKSSEFVFVAHHYDIYEEFSIEHLEKFVAWRDLNMSSCGYQDDEKPRLFVFIISESKDKLLKYNEIISLANLNIEIFRLLYKYSDMISPNDGKLYYLVELDDKNQEIYMY